MGGRTRRRLPYCRRRYVLCPMVRWLRSRYGHLYVQEPLITKHEKTRNTMKTQRKVSKKVKTAPKLEYRIVVYPDFDYEVGAEEGSEFYDDEIQTLEQYGAWGYVVESRKIEQCDTCAKTYDWELVDSCAGFLGDNTDYMHREAMANVP